MQAENFNFEISAEVRRAIEEMGYESPTPIQEQAIPKMLTGSDIIGQAQTGTGKTAAFGIPLVEAIDPTQRHVQAIVLCPTRELALQTAGEVVKLSRYKQRLTVVPVYGGQPIERQLRMLQNGAQIVVGTPGRVMDHMDRGTLDLSHVHIAVLDEADEMLDMGFRDDIEKILSATPVERQTALFSATMPYPIMMLSKKYLRDPEIVRIETKKLTVEAIDQTYISVRSFHKGELLARLLLRDEAKVALVFCNTKRCVEEVVTDLQSRGFSAAGLHGDMRQIERDAIMARFRQGMVRILVATDVAARGLDVDGIEAVFNYDMPQDAEYYVHRVGRTGRAGRAGRAYTFVVGREVSRMWEYRKLTGAKILCEKAPTGADIRGAEEKRFVADVTRRADEENSEETRRMAMELLEKVDAETAVATMLEMLTEAGKTKIRAELDLDVPEPPRGMAPRPGQRLPDNRSFRGAPRGGRSSAPGRSSGGNRPPFRGKPGPRPHAPISHRQG